MDSSHQILIWHRVFQKHLSYQNNNGLFKIRQILLSSWSSVLRTYNFCYCWNLTKRSSSQATSQPRQKYPPHALKNSLSITSKPPKKPSQVPTSQSQAHLATIPLPTVQKTANKKESRALQLIAMPAQERNKKAEPRERRILRRSRSLTKTQTAQEAAAAAAAAARRVWTHLPLGEDARIVPSPVGEAYLSERDPEVQPPLRNSARASERRQL